MNEQSGCEELFLYASFISMALIAIFSTIAAGIGAAHFAETGWLGVLLPAGLAVLAGLSFVGVVAKMDERKER